MLRRSAALALAVIASLGATACGEENTKAQDGQLAAAESEALYVDLGGLTYQVQLSRQLNPKDPTDQAYFQNLAPGQDTLPAGEVWFGVFLRVENQTKDSIASARELSVEDTQGKEFEPVESENLFAYRPETIPGGGFLPNPESLTAQTGTRGRLALFKIPLASLDNRPLELTIRNPSNAENTAAVDLDV